MVDTLFSLIGIMFLFVITLWVFMLAFILGVFMPFVVALKLLFNRDLLKVLREAFENPFGPN